MHKYPSRHGNSWKDKLDTMSCGVKYVYSDDSPYDLGWLQYTTTIGRLWNNGSGCADITTGLSAAAGNAGAVSDPTTVFRNFTCKDDEKYAIIYAVDQELGKLYPSVIGGFNCVDKRDWGEYGPPRYWDLNMKDRRSVMPLDMGPYISSAGTDKRRPISIAAHSSRSSRGTPPIATGPAPPRLVSRKDIPSDTQTCAIASWNTTTSSQTSSFFNFTIVIGVDYAKGKGCDDVKTALASSLANSSSSIPNSGFAS
ncbi:hypothetical protein LTR78_000135 [Recurvomyces mirabilis]|uniref:Uncharacterized protein n=1 Tax=Recurvomyces mirabilis TaxID=574656 RepID=A0AAE1C6A8_9PEZI|nr:hypothetical protein LTR78_000135 [Recurvomyces mirabilis]KAK5161792.1 hypothetical protein LTS14_000137 [Recurvomyces mirabilis]